MDPLSQAVVGVTLAVACCPKKEWVKPAVIAGAVGGMLPDLDVLIRSSGDPLLAVEYHRHFTHSLAFVPIGGLLAALLCWPALKKQLPFLWLYIFAALGYATHGILDSMTNYGTHLLWPFTERRESWNLISIIDPVFTLTVLVLCGLAYRKSARGYVLAAAAFACVYWSAGYMQREAATRHLYQLAGQRGHSIERFEAKPSFANIVVWRTQYQHAGHYYIDAIRLFPGASPKWYEGASIRAFDSRQWAASQDAGLRRTRDVMRFAFFSDGWLAQTSDTPQVISDMRFAMLPNSAEPLWGIALGAQDEPVQFVSLRRNRTDAMPMLWKMVMGEDLPKDVLASR